MDVFFGWRWWHIGTNLILFGIKSALTLKKNLIVNLSITKKKLKTKIQSYGDEAKDFHNKEVSKLFISNHNCLS